MFEYQSWTELCGIENILISSTGILKLMSMKQSLFSFMGTSFVENGEVGGFNLFRCLKRYYGIAHLF